MMTINRKFSAVALAAVLGAGLGTAGTGATTASECDMHWLCGDGMTGVERVLADGPAGNPGPPPGPAPAPGGGAQPNDDMHW